MRASSRWKVILPVAALFAGCAKGIDPPAETTPKKIEAGEFTMGGSDRDPCDKSTIENDGKKIPGCLSARVQSETLQHRVKVKGFCLDEHEVTVDQYRHCVARDECSKPKTDAGLPNTDSYISRYYSKHDRYGDHPVVGVTVEQAREFCAFHGGRLPTEIEWEFAARSRGSASRGALVWEGRNFVSGCTQNKGQVAFGDCVDLEPKEVSSSAADVTEQGVRDLAGNVQEWVEDEFSFFAYCADDQGDETIDDLYIVKSTDDYRRRSASDPEEADPTREVPASLLMADASCVDVASDDPNNNRRGGGCADQWENCMTVCSKAWRGDPSISQGQSRWKDEECRDLAAGDLDDDVDCGDCAAAPDPDACNAYCDCLDAVDEPAESGGECVQQCIATAMSCLDTNCSAEGVASACVNTSRSDSTAERVPKPQPVCHVRGAGAAFDATKRADGSAGPYVEQVSGGVLDGVHVVRGGHFAESDACGVRTTRRDSRKGDSPSGVIGFRCAYDLPSDRCR